MKMIPLEIQARAEGTSPSQLRKENTIPCVLYGNKTENVSLQCDHNELFRTYVKAGESTIVELDINSEKVPVLFHSIDFHPVSDKIMHVDFYAVDMKKEIEAKVPVHLTGEAPAVKELGGVLVTVLDHVTVKCLPTVLPKALEIDISSLAEFGDSITVASINVPENVIISEEETQMIATVQEPRRIEVEEEVVVEGEEGEEGEEGAEEGEEGEEGAEEGKEGEGAEGAEAKGEGKKES